MQVSDASGNRRETVGAFSSEGDSPGSFVRSLSEGARRLSGKAVHATESFFLGPRGPSNSLTQQLLGPDARLPSTAQSSFCAHGATTTTTPGVTTTPRSGSLSLSKRVVNVVKTAVDYTSHTWALITSACLSTIGAGAGAWIMVKHSKVLRFDDGTATLAVFCFALAFFMHGLKTKYLHNLRHPTILSDGLQRLSVFYRHSFELALVTALLSTDVPEYGMVVGALMIGTVTRKRLEELVLSSDRPPTSKNPPETHLWPGLWPVCKENKDLVIPLAIFIIQTGCVTFYVPFDKRTHDWKVFTAAAGVAGMSACAAGVLERIGKRWKTLKGGVPPLMLRFVLARFDSATVGIFCALIIRARTNLKVLLFMLPIGASLGGNYERQSLLFGKAENARGRSTPAPKARLICCLPPDKQSKLCQVTTNLVLLSLAAGCWFIPNTKYLGEISHLVGAIPPGILSYYIGIYARDKEGPITTKIRFLMDRGQLQLSALLELLNSFRRMAIDAGDHDLSERYLWATMVVGGVCAGFYRAGSDSHSNDDSKFWKSQFRSNYFWDLVIAGILRHFSAKV